MYLFLKRPLEDINAVQESSELQPVDGITSAGQPDENALRIIADAGYVMVVDMRGESENRGLDEQSTVEQLGMKYVSFPITGGEQISMDSARALDELLATAERAETQPNISRIKKQGQQPRPRDTS